MSEINVNSFQLRYIPIQTVPKKKAWAIIARAFLPFPDGRGQRFGKSGYTTAAIFTCLPYDGGRPKKGEFFS